MIARLSYRVYCHPVKSPKTPEFEAAVKDAKAVSKTVGDNSATLRIIDRLIAERNEMLIKHRELRDLFE